MEYDRHWIVNQRMINDSIENRSNTIAWLDSVRRLYLDQYKEATEAVEITAKFKSELFETIQTSKYAREIFKKKKTRKTQDNHP